jgi:hypothetical protein
MESVLPNLLFARAYFFRYRRSESVQRHYLRNEERILQLMELLQTPVSRTTTTILASFNFEDPVRVAPTPEQFDAGVADLAPIPQSQCSICQDVLSDPAVSLRACGHQFHRTCAVTWYTQSVHCPLCRHDIREN